MSKIFYLFLFQDPASSFAYQLTSLHNDVMWFVFLILALVYWVLYKILLDYSWNVLNKRVGFLSSSFILNFFFYIKFIIMDLYMNFKYYYVIFHLSVMQSHFEIFVSNFPEYSKLTEIPATTLYPVFGVEWTPTFEIMLEEYVDSLLFNFNTKARITFNDNYLKTLSWNHNTKIEYIFAAFPTLIIGLILLPSFYLLYAMDEDLEPLYTVKIVGNQWYWQYEFNNHTIYNDRLVSVKKDFQSTMVLEEYLSKGKSRLLEVDNALIVPLNVTLRFLVTSSDVLHAWALPELAIKIDAVPGRLNQFLSAIARPGIFYGQCSELCGVGHSFMPIKVQAIPVEFWIEMYMKKNVNKDKTDENVFEPSIEMEKVSTNNVNGVKIFERMLENYEKKLNDNFNNDYNFNKKSSFLAEYLDSRKKCKNL